MPEGTTFKGGLELNFFAQREFESTKGIEPSQQTSIIARNILRFFTMGWTNSWTEFLTPTNAYAFFVQRDYELLRELRFALQQGFLVLFDQLKEKQLTPDEREQVQLYLSNCLSMLPYGDLTPYESFKIPQCIDGVWESVEYQVTPIELTQAAGWRGIFTRDHDRVFAYGLEPLFQKRAESHLIFMGTTYPAGQGFLTQVKTDSKGFETVGRSLYRTGRERIHEWLAKQANSIHVCGVSLGGSLSLLLAIDKGNYTLSRVDALNPAGLYELLFKNSYDHWDELTTKPKVVIQKQGDDPVAAFGFWKKEWVILQVTPPKEKRGPNGLFDHCLNYAGFAETTFEYVAAEQDNSNRNSKIFLLNALCRSFIYYYFMVPYTYAVRPFGYYLTQRKSGAGEKEVSISGNNSQLAKIHDPSLPRNQTMDIYDTDNLVDLLCTKQQINTYYRVMRGLVKGKELIPSEEMESKHAKGVTKKALLEACQNTQNSDESVLFKATKAKASHIRHTLTLVDKLGIDNQEQLKQALEKSYAEYRFGKH